MFFRKKQTSPTSVAKKGIKKMDTVVTGVILGGIVASIYGVKKLQEKDAESKKNIPLPPEPEESQKKSFWQRLFRR